MYTTQEDIIKSGIPEDDLIQLTDNADLGVVDSDAVDRVIAQQDELIDGYLRSRYDLPLDPVPGLLGSIAVALCCRALYRLRPQVDTPESISEAAQEAKSTLKQLQQGTMKLDVAVVTGSSGASFVAAPRRSSRDSLAGLL